MTPAREARTGVLGGTFDPIHAGHLDVADAARTELALDEVWLVPSCVPPHRMAGPHASVHHRFAMVALAAADRPGIVASDLELQAPGPSFTSATLNRLAATGRRPWQLFFITGADAFEEITTWRDYPDILDRAHFVVISRPGTPVGSLRRRLPALAPRMIGPDADLERRLVAGGATGVFLLDAATADVSSTDIRRRVASGGSLAGLVPAGVETYIRRHRLYATSSPADDLHD